MEIKKVGVAGCARSERGVRSALLRIQSGYRTTAVADPATVISPTLTIFTSNIKNLEPRTGCPLGDLELGATLARTLSHKGTKNISRFRFSPLLPQRERGGAQHRGEGLQSRIYA